MSGTVNLRIAKIIVLILSVFDIILAIGFFIKASVNKNIDYKYIHNETEWNVLYISLIACAILMLYGIFRNEHLFVIAGLVLKVLTALILIYAVIRGKLENLRCERELCRFTETSYCAACYSGTRKNKFEYEYTPRWTLYVILEIVAFLSYTCMSSKKPTKKRHHQQFTTSTSV